MLRCKVMLLGALALACEAPPGGCLDPEDCDEGLGCVLLAADAARGVCVEVVEGDPMPGSPYLEELFPQPKVDVLLVVDNSPAMAGRQAQLAGSIDALVTALRDVSPAILRFGVTTTDLGNPLCAGPPTGGRLQLTSCRERLDDFVDAGAGIDVQAACTDACGLASIDVLATENGDDPERAPRPWLEETYGSDNLVGDVDLAEALRCAVLQGVSGCRFTSPIAAIERALDPGPNDPWRGFHLTDAFLLLVVLSAENECSIAAGHQDIFVDDPAFWGDLMPPDLTPAVCWRAGVSCTGPGPVYDDCEATDLGADGKPAAPGDAVLVPVSAAAEAIRVATDLQFPSRSAPATVMLVLGGVPEGYPEGQAIAYADASDPAFQTAHGIGPSCEASGAAAPPPVRLAALAAEFPADGPPLLDSVCEDDFSARFTALGAAMADFTRPGCIEGCVADDDPETPALDPWCEVQYVDLAKAVRPQTVPACIREGDAWTPPLGSPRCFIARTGADVDPRCEALGSNVSIDLVRPQAEELSALYYVYCKPVLPFTHDCPNP